MKDNLSKEKRIKTLLASFNEKITDVQRQIFDNKQKQLNNAQEQEAALDEKRKTVVESGTHSSNYILASFDYNLALTNKIKDLELEMRHLKNEQNKLNKRLIKIFRKKIAIETLAKKIKNLLEKESDKHETLIAQEVAFRNSRSNQ